MEAIIVRPRNKKELSAIKHFFKALDLQYESSPEMTEEEFYCKIDKSINQVRTGKVIRISKENQKEFLGL